MENKYLHWRRKSTIIDFSKIPDEYLDGEFDPTKKDYIFTYLPLPDEEIHSWHSGWWSNEYNRALHYAEKYGLIEFIDREDAEE